MEFYNLRDQPFGVTPDPNFLYLSTGHREALSSLLYAIETGQGFAAVIANPGMGKTTILFRIQELLGDYARTAFMFQTQCTSREFLQYVSADLGIVAPKKGTGSLIEQMNQFLFQESKRGRRVVLVIDEAQNLKIPVLETIRMLSNFETASSKLLQIVLAGQPPLADKLTHPGLVQLRQRISTVVRLNRLKPDEVVEYINHRLRVAGHNGPSLFSSEAFSLISERSEGIPRNINTICFNALSLGFAKEQKIISSEIVREVVGDLDMRSLAVQKPVGKDSIPKETPTIPTEDTAFVTRPSPGNSKGTNMSFLSFQTLSRTVRWGGSVAACALFLVVYLAAWHPNHLQRVDQRLEGTTPQHQINPELFRREGTMTFTVFVKPNDTLANICALYLGKFDPSVVREVRRLNPVLSNLDFLTIGQAIQLPLVPGTWKPIDGNKNVAGIESPKRGKAHEPKF